MGEGACPQVGWLISQLWLTWLPRVPRPWYRALGGGSRLPSGPDTWPGQVRSGMQQTEGETSAEWGPGTPEFAGSSSPKTCGVGVRAGEGGAGRGGGEELQDSPAPLSPRDMHSYTPCGRTRVTQFLAPVLHPQPACCGTLRKVHPEAEVVEAGRALSDPERKPFDI